MMKCNIQFFTLLVTTAILSGCSGIHYNEGASRLAISDTKEATLKPLFFPANSTEAHYKIKKTKDAVSVNLISAHICDFLELSLAGFNSGEMLSRSNAKSEICSNDDKPLAVDASSLRRRTRGEILIIAKVGELSDLNGLTFDAGKLQDTGRVIYYNADVRESGQLINAMNIPIYGPLVYTGGRFAIDLSVVELDSQENEQIKALLGKLAAIGTTVSATSTGPILDTLNSLGSTLISGNGDDIELRYQALYDLPSENSGTQVHRMELTEGYLALVREEHRSRLPNWETLCIDKEAGLIRKINSDTAICNGDVYRDRTWLLLRVAKEDKNSDFVQKAIATEVVSEFLNRSKTDLQGNDPSTELAEALDKLKSDLNQIK